MPASESPESKPGKLNVFISYSRDDNEFADELVASLELLGYATTIDRHSITAGDDWRARLGALIAAADTVVFVLSPSSAASTMCQWEVEETARLGKRILPVVWRPVPLDAQPAKLKELQQTFFGAGHSFAKGLTDLRRALDTDLSWVREHTRLTAMAERWAGDQTRTKSMGDHALLQGADIDDAEARLKRVPRTGPIPSATLLAFVQASRDAANRRASEQQSQLEERERLLKTAETAALGTARMQARIGRLLWGFGALVLALLGLQGWQSLDLARRETLVYTSLAAQAYREEHFDRGMRFALMTYPPQGCLTCAPSSELEGKLAGGPVMTRLRTTLRGHTNTVFRASFSPDGRRIVTASFDNTARLWDAETGKEIAVLKAHTNEVNAASFSPDGKRVVTASSDQTARLWDAETGKEIAVLKAHTNWVRSASFSPDGKRVVTASDDQTARLWDAETGKEIAVLKAHTGLVLAASFSPDGKRVVTASSDQTARLWDAETGKEIAVLKAHEGIAFMASWRRDGRRIVTSGQDNVARVWDVSWVNVSGAELRDRVCAGPLHGAQELTAIELEDPILRGITQKNVCARRGPLSLDYWTALPGQWWAALRGVR